MERVHTRHCEEVIMKRLGRGHYLSDTEVALVNEKAGYINLV